MRERKVTREALCLGIHDEIDPALAIESDILGAMAGQCRKSESTKQPIQRRRVGGRELDELESAGSHRIVLLAVHADSPVPTVY
jgi:hypothetical protein